MYIGDYLGRREIYSPDKLAIVDAGKDPQLRLTYEEWDRRVNQLANWLEERVGVSYRDRVAILARDGVEHLDLFYACGKLGAIHTALNWRLHWRELVTLIEDTTPKALIYSDDFKEAVEQIAKQEPSTSIHHYLHIEGEGIPGSLHYETTLQSSPDIPVTNEALEAEDVACLLFTGGTTGLPKGAQISHRQVCWNVLNTVIHDLTHDDIYLCVFPLFHAGGLFAYVSSQVIFGNTTILTRQFEPAQVLDLIQTEAVTVFAAVPTMYQMLTQAPNWESADLSSLRFCTSGGAPLPVPLVEQYTREKGVRFKQGFGMTEYGPGLFALPPEDAIRKAGSIGRPNFFVDVRVVDNDNRPLGPNQVGELVLKGPSGCSGYWNNPEASAAMIDDQGWFHTGDLVYHDEGWYFYVVERKKDMFISGGENVYPVEIENVLYKHPAVHMCAVIGVPDEKWGEVGKACVVLKPGTVATEQELLAFLQEHLARYKVPKSVSFLETLPLSGMGKILKRELREQFVKQ
ncbi:MAG TPA: long-chain fatty acid--CoA ligase [Anaerolineales bacterium]|jgi:fatty-acyl-CoA synthase|nr:long-chain fatty acid--CoA ligase [Anaerolineales bacterium]